MKPKDDTRILVEETFESLSGIRRAEANPFLFTRIQARLQNLLHQPFSEKVGRFIAKPLVATFVIIFILAINIIVISTGSGLSSGEQSQLSPTDYYNLAVNTLYDYENQEP